MNQSIFLVVVLLLAIASCSDSKQAKDNEVVSVGAWQEIEVDEQVREATKFAMGYIMGAAQLREITRVKRQVVKGYKYDINFQLHSGEEWSAIVYRDLDGSFTLVEGPEKVSGE